MIRALILAAGRGSRMGSLTESKPKCLLELCGKELLEYQVYALKKAGVGQVGIVCGYQKDKLKPYIDSHNLAGFENSKWESTNMVATMLCAKEWLLESERFIISYSDIFYSFAGVQDLLKSPCDMGILYDKNWRKLWELRFKNPLLDAETFKLDSNNNLIEIGQRSDSLDSIYGQFMGLLVFSNSGFKSLLKSIESNKLDTNKLDSTALLNLALQYGANISCIAYSDVWGECDSKSDIDLYEKQFSSHIKELINEK